MRRYLSLLWVLASVVAASAQTSSVPIGPSSGGGGGGGGGGSGVSSLAAGCQATVVPLTGAVTVSTKFVLSSNSPVVTTPYAINGTSDPCNLILLNSGASVLTLGSAATTGFGNGTYWAIDNQTGGAATLNITTSTLDGLSTVPIASGKTIAFQSDGTNYHFTQAPAAAAVSPGGSSGQLQTNNGSGGFAGVAGVTAGQMPALTGDCTTTAGAVAVTCAGRRAAADTSVTQAAGDQLIAFTSITAARTVTLLAASTLPAGRRLVLVDESGSVTPAITISFVPNGTDNIQGSNTTQVACATAKCFVEMETDGVSNWYVVRRSEDSQLFTASGTWNRVIGVTDVTLNGCGNGGGGGGGATVATATASSGGAAGGGGDCHFVSLKASDAGASQSITIGSTGTGGAGSATLAGANGSNGVPGGNNLFGAPLCSACTFFGGGGGGGGKNSATASIGGSGASQWSAGNTNSITVPAGCFNNGGGNGGAGLNQSTCGGPGSGSSTSGGAAFFGGYSSLAAPGGQGAGGLTSGTGPGSASGGSGGGSLGCQTPPVGGTVSATQATANGGSTAADVPYHPGCGGGGGAGAIQTSVPGNGGLGTSGAGGGGGGSLCSAGGSCATSPLAVVGGAGGNGGIGYVQAIAR